jgi:hypothetical protein
MAHEAEQARLLSSIGRAGVRLPLAGWDVAETARFVRAAANADPPPGLVEHLHDLTDGNPFFVDEIVRSCSPRAADTCPTRWRCACRAASARRFTSACAR